MNHMLTRGAIQELLMIKLMKINGYDQIQLFLKNFHQLKMLHIEIIKSYDLKEFRR